MLSSYEIFTATCDKCGKNFNEVIEEEFTSEQELIATLTQENWKVTNHSCLCDKCQ